MELDLSLEIVVDLLDLVFIYLFSEIKWLDL